MQSNLVFIGDVTPTTRVWSVKVRVEEKMQPRLGTKSPTHYQRVILADEKGTKVVATLYEDDIEVLKNTLLPDNTYIISKARVVSVKEEYKIVDHPYQWIINTKTAILRVNENMVNHTMASSVFTPLSELPNLLGSRSLIDLLVVVFDKLPQRSIASSGRTVLLQDLGVVDSSMKPRVLTLWSNLAAEFGTKLVVDAHNMPVVKFTRFVVNTYYGISLGSTTMSSSLISPSIPEAVKLAAWKRNHVAELKALANSKEYMSVPQSSNASVSFPMMDISRLLNSATYGKMKTRAKAKIADLDQRCFYMACDKCPSSTTAELDWEFECTRCQETSVAIPRAKVLLTLYDDLAEIEAHAFGPIAESILKIPASVCMNNYLQDKDDYLSDTNQVLEKENYIFLVRKRPVTRNKVEQDQYIIVEILTEDSDIVGGDSNVEVGKQKCKDTTVDRTEHGSPNESFKDGEYFDNDNSSEKLTAKGKSIEAALDNSPKKSTKKGTRKLVLEGASGDDDEPIMTSFKRKKD